MPNHITVKKSVNVAGNPISIVLREGASHWSNALNNFKSIWKLITGSTQPKMLAEGDSWLCYPLNTTDDLCDSLTKYYIINHRAVAGNELYRYALSKNLAFLLKMTKEDNYDFLMLSGGGNDVLGDGINEFVRSNTNATKASDFISFVNLRENMIALMEDYRTVIQAFANEAPRTKILAHSYVTPFPQRDGKWIGQKFVAMNIPEKYWHEIIDICLREFRAQMSKLDSEYSNFRHVDISSSFKNTQGIWFDEIHMKKVALAVAGRHIHNFASKWQ